MSDTEQPQIYLITPPVLEPSTHLDLLRRMLDTHPVACLRIDLATRDPGKLAQATDLYRSVAHERDVAIVVSNDVDLAQRAGLDGVHLTDATKSVRNARKTLGPDAIVGSFCGTSRHHGLEAGEAGADYIAFGPMAGGAEIADLDMFAWWSEMIELPVVAEGTLDLSMTETLAPVTDFIALREEIWDCPDPLVSLGAYLERLA